MFELKLHTIKCVLYECGEPEFENRIRLVAVVESRAQGAPGRSCMCEKEGGRGGTEGRREGGGERGSAGREGERERGREGERERGKA